MNSKNYSRYALILLTAIYTLNLVDRGLIALLLQSIKIDLSLSDTQLGAVTGIVFGVFYAVLGIPVARWADRGNRSIISALAITAWGIVVMAHYLIGNYWQLVGARTAAAVGEAGCKPPTYSLVGEYFPKPAERTRAMSIYWLGSPLGLLLSFGLGGWLNSVIGWRATFLVMGVPGLLLGALAFFSLSDPRSVRGINHLHTSSLGDSLRALWRTKTCRHLCIAIVLIYTLSYGISPWEVAFMQRSHGMGTAELGLWLGLITSASGIVGLLAGGYIATRWFSENEPGQLRLSALSILVVLPAFIVFLLAANRYVALLALIPFAMAFIFFMAPTFALLQRLLPSDTWATTLSVTMFLANLLGMGLAPQLIGILSDALHPRFGINSLRISLLLISIIGLMAAWQLWRASAAVAHDLAHTGSKQHAASAAPGACREGA